MHQPFLQTGNGDQQTLIKLFEYEFIKFHH